MFLAGWLVARWWDVGRYVMSGFGLVVEMSGTWLCVMLTLMWDGRASAVFDLVRNMTCDDSL